MKLSAYTLGSEDRYAAIFEHRGGPSFAARHGLSPEQYQQAFDDLARGGFRLVQVSGCAIP